jgi:protein PhnA
VGIIFRRKGSGMTDGGSEGDWVFDEATGEWLSPEDAAARDAAKGGDSGGDGGSDVRDANGTKLADGDSVILIRDLKVKGAGQTLKRGTVVKAIRLTANPEEIDCRTEGIKGLVLRTEYVKKR